MSVVDTTLFQNGKYTPFRGLSKVAGPVGTFSNVMSATGDATGDPVTLNLTSRFEEFGFHYAFVPTLITILDTLSTVEFVVLTHSAEGNERVLDGLQVITAPIAHSGAGGNVGFFEGSQLAVPWEVEQDAATRRLCSVLWSTNENLKSYQVKIYGLMFDQEILARELAAKPGNIYLGIR